MPVLLRAKCVIVGDATVGKSALTQAYHSDGSTFPKTYTMTTGLELCTKTVNVGGHANSDSVEIFLCDCAGKEVFQDVLKEQWSHPNMLMIVFDVTNEQSFQNCGKWLDLVEKTRKHKADVPTVLVANKTDLQQRRVISGKEAADFANNRGMEYFECSAKETQNIDAPFLHLAKQYHQMYTSRVEFVKQLV